jgi:hypothetical protein
MKTGARRKDTGWKDALDAGGNDWKAVCELNRAFASTGRRENTDTILPIQNSKVITTVDSKRQLARPAERKS